MNRILLLLLTTSIVISASTAEAQQYKLRQSTKVSGMTMESTIYVKGMRKRTETAGVMGMPPQPVTIEQCDLQRTVKLNDKKKLYFIEPFGQEPEVIDEDVKPAANTKTKPVAVTEKGGVIHMYYSIRDTGERKKMYGFTARRIWTTMKMKPSEKTCSLKDSMLMKTDGWYIDLPQFNCQVRYASSVSFAKDPQKPECQDKFVTHRSGKGKLGFPLVEKRTIIMGNGKAQTSEFTTDLETLELSTVKLDSMLFEIPPGYTETKNEADLQDKMDMNAIIEQYKNQGNQTSPGYNAISNTGEKPEGVLRIGIYEPKNDGQLQAVALQQYMAGIYNNGKIQAVAITSEEEAISKQCDYTLTTEFTKMKSGSKVGGLLKAVKNADPNASSSFNIEASLVLKSLGSQPAPSPQTVSGKYDGKADDAAKKAMDEGSRLVLKALK